MGRVFLLKCVIISAMAFLNTVYAQSSAPITWGKYQPSKEDGGKIVIVDWNSTEGLKKLSDSKYKNDFFQTAHAFQPTMNGVYASIAAAVIVLNAMRLPKALVPSDSELEIKKPKALGGGVVLFPAYSQLTFLNQQTDAVKDRKLILLKNANFKNQGDKKQFSPGLGLAHLKEILEKHYKARAEIAYAVQEVEEGSANLRKTLKNVLVDQTSFVISNFRGDVFGANNEGTMSPIVAFDEASDSVLVLDTGGHKNPWYWVPVRALYRAMNVPYAGNNRGYMIVSEMDNKG